MTTVLFTWDVNERLRRFLNSRIGMLPNINLIFPFDSSPQAIIKLASSADVIVGWRPTEELLLAAKRLQLFISPGAGVQHLIEPFKRLSHSKEVRLANCHSNSYFVAQHVVALLLALMNKIISHHNWMVAGEWRKGDKDAKSLPLKDREVGLLGYGAINTKVHKFLASFGPKFSILRQDWRKQYSQLPTPAKKYGFSELHQFLDEIDILIIAVPLTSLTRDLIQTRELEFLGARGLLVNVARGQIVNEEALFKALKNNVITGAAIDVWYDYHPKPDNHGLRYPFSHPFQQLGNVVLSPHRAASPLDNLQRWNEVIENIEKFSKGDKELINIVDLKKEY
jgi:phosphoglycerate dehydrogenase-like enzyme